MAQTKTRVPSKRSDGTKKNQTRSRGPSSKSNASSKTSKSRAPSSKSRGSSKPRPVEMVGKAGDTVGSATGKATTAVGQAAKKAKVPLVAGGAALAGAAGGLALGSRRARRGKGIARAMPRRPQVKVRSRDLANAAKEMGNFGVQLGQLASELQRSRESSNGKDHRSPVEVVLEGLTARRRRA